MRSDPLWPALPLSQWQQSCETLYRWTQMVGKIRLALTPLVNHWWNVTLHVTSRGLTTTPIPYLNGTFEIAFDFVGHRLVIDTSGGDSEQMILGPKSVADFHSELMDRLARLGISVHIWTMPSEIADAVAFENDHGNAQYDPAWVHRFWRALLSADRVFKQFRSRFIGKVSPVHFFWGGFDLAVTRFSGRRAPLLTGNWPNVAAWVMQEAYSHEVSSCGFWPGNGGFGQAAFYVYAYPEPKGLGDEGLKTSGASYHPDLGQFILPYDVVAGAKEPENLLLGFLQETYERTAVLAGWDRAALERSI
jgi:uncharacterized protein DUF5996